MLAGPEVQALLRKAVAAVLGALLGLMLLGALLIGGLVMVWHAAILGLSPWVGEAGAWGMTGGVCFALLALFFYRMIRGPLRAAAGETGRASGGSMVARLRRLIAENPWESVVAAFAVGVAGQADPRLRQFLLQSGLAMIRAANAVDGGEAENDAPADDDLSANDPQ
ncbi:hypothetical protein [Marinobacter sp. JSM 1782161]|uniref:hypothetical protein n=1 Tax=Marinobacter sp. JSM 1782161 TaxID=2685906 RepID=UPI001403D6B5|nr:hypothetical protein [Marinobacter sp. JSM 1782161]